MRMTIVEATITGRFFFQNSSFRNINTSYNEARRA